MPAVSKCDHFYVWQSPAGTSHSARLCMGCGQPDPAWLDEVYSGQRTDELRHNLGTCPACRDYLWADVTIVSRVAPPSLSVEGKTLTHSNARAVAMRVEHRCDSRYDEPSENSSSPGPTTAGDD